MKPPGQSFEVVWSDRAKEDEATMLKSIEAIIEKDGEVHLKEPVCLASP